MLTQTMETSAASKNDVEDEIWEALRMDELQDQMTTELAPGENSVMMGTGSTHNACYACSNSNTTAGCGTCSM